MSFQDDIGKEYPAFFQRLRCMSLLLPFGTTNESSKMESFASMVIAPKKQFAIEKARVEYLASFNTDIYTKALSDNRLDHWESNAVVLFSAIYLGLMYGKSDSNVDYLYRPDKYLVFVLTENHILNLKDNSVGLDYDRFEAFLKYLKSLPLLDVKEFKFKGVSGQVVKKEDVYASYAKLLEVESNRTGAHPYVINVVDRLLSLGIYERKSIIQVFLESVIDMFRCDDVTENDLEEALQTDAFFLNHQWLFNRLFKKDYNNYCNDMLFYLNQNKDSIFIGNKKLSSYFPAKYVFSADSSVFIKLINSFINNTLQWKVVQFDTKTNKLVVKLFMDNLFVYNKSLFFGLQAFILYVKEKFLTSFTDMEVIIYIRKNKENLDNIYQAVKGWTTILRNTGEGSRLTVFRQPMEEDDGLLQGKLADIDLKESMEAVGQLYPLDNRKLVTVKEEVVVSDNRDVVESDSEFKTYPVLSYDHFYVEALEALEKDTRYVPALRKQFSNALSALRMVAPRVKHKKIPLLDYVKGITYEADNFPTLVLLNFFGNYTVPVRETKFMDGMIHHIFHFKGMEHFGAFAGLMLLAYAYNSIMDTHFKVALNFHFLDNEIAFVKPFLNDWVTSLLDIEEVDHIEVYKGESLLHICDRNK